MLDMKGVSLLNYNLIFFNETNLVRYGEWLFPDVKEHTYVHIGNNSSTSTRYIFDL